MSESESGSGSGAGPRRRREVQLLRRSRGSRGMPVEGREDWDAEIGESGNRMNVRMRVQAMMCRAARHVYIIPNGGHTKRRSPSPGEARCVRGETGGDHMTSTERAGCLVAVFPAHMSPPSPTHASHVSTIPAAKFHWGAPRTHAGSRVPLIIRGIFCADDHTVLSPVPSLEAHPRLVADTPAPAAALPLAL